MDADEMARDWLSERGVAMWVDYHAEALGAVEAWKRDAAELSSLRAKVQADEAARANEPMVDVSPEPPRRVTGADLLAQAGSGATTLGVPTSPGVTAGAIAVALAGGA